MNCRLLRVLSAVLPLPGAAAALLLPHLLHRPPSPAAQLPRRVAVAQPAISQPMRQAFAPVRPNHSRAAIGLGAGPLDRLRWVWLPQVGPGIAAGSMLAVLFGLWVLLAR